MTALYPAVYSKGEGGLLRGIGARGLVRQDAAQALQGALLQARNLHLRKAQFPGDLRLGKFFKITQVNDLALADFEKI